MCQVLSLVLDMSISVFRVSYVIRDMSSFFFPAEILVCQDLSGLPHCP